MADIKQVVDFENAAETVAKKYIKNTKNDYVEFAPHFHDTELITILLYIQKRKLWMRQVKDNELEPEFRALENGFRYWIGLGGHTAIIQTRGAKFATQIDSPPDLLNGGRAKILSDLIVTTNGIVVISERCGGSFFRFIIAYPQNEAVLKYLSNARFEDYTGYAQSLNAFYLGQFQCGIIDQKKHEMKYIDIPECYREPYRSIL